MKTDESIYNAYKQYPNNKKKHIYQRSFESRYFLYTYFMTCQKHKDITACKQHTQNLKIKFDEYSNYHLKII